MKRARPPHTYSYETPLHDDFMQVCNERGEKASNVVRKWIILYLKAWKKRFPSTKYKKETERILAVTEEA